MPWPQTTKIDDEELYYALRTEWIMSILGLRNRQAIHHYVNRGWPEENYKKVFHALIDFLIVRVGKKRLIEVIEERQEREV